jgi:probable rRNA maturation factor
MIEIEVLHRALAPGAPSRQELQRLCATAAARFGIGDGHVAIEFVDATRIAALNGAHRGKREPTDVLSFPIDGVQALAGAHDRAGAPQQAGAPGDAGAPGGAGGPQDAGAPPRELGDIFICPEHTADLREAVAHGMLHLLGMDHESDDGEMLALQDELLQGAPR